MSTNQAQKISGLYNYIQVTGVQEDIQASSGSAPAEILNAWRGLTLFTCPFVEYVGATKSNVDGFRYRVPADKALQVLEQKNPSAALYWKEYGYPGNEESKQYFYFLSNAVRTFCGVFQYQEQSQSA